MGTNIRTSVAETNPFYISKHEYLMAKHFALQYPEWKKKKNEIQTRLNYGLNIGCGHNDTVARPIENAIEKAEEYSVRMSLVEQTAKIAGEDIWEYVLLGVTTECSYEHLRLVKGIPCCKDSYYKMYRKFFWILTHEFYNLLNGNLNNFEEGEKNGRENDRPAVGRTDPKNL